MKAVIGELTLKNLALKSTMLLTRGRDEVMQVHSEMKQERHYVTISQLSRWSGIPRRTLYYRPKARTPKLDEDRVKRVKEKMQKFPTYGYRRLALQTGMNKKAVQRIFQLKGWQVKKRSKGHRPRAKAMPSRTTIPDTR